MLEESTTHRIPYPELRAIGELMHAHLDAHQGRLRAMVAFGDLLTSGGTFDIDILEVVEGWHGNRMLVFSGSPQLPIRGQLRLYLLTPEDFENPQGIRDEAERRWALSLLDRLRRGYVIQLQVPPGYAREVLQGAGAARQLAPPGEGYAELEDPLTLTVKRP